MNNKNFFLGIVLIVLGAIWILLNKGIINIGILETILRFWPVFLILLGINIVFKGSNLSKMLSLIIVILTFAIGGYLYKTGNVNFRYDIGFENFGDTKNIEKIIKKDGIKESELTLNFGSCNLKMGGESEELISFSLPNENIKKSFKSINNKAKITFDDNGDKKIFSKSKSDYIYIYELNNDVKWDIEINSGDIEGSFDFSDIQVDSISVNSGAGDLEFDIGDKSKHCKMEINGAAIDLIINVNKNLGVAIENSAALKDTVVDEKEFDKIDGKYFSKNYDESKKKIDIELNAAISDIIVNRK